MFKKGDKIRCLRNSSGDGPLAAAHSSYKKGQIYIVEGMYGHNQSVLTVEDSRGSIGNGWSVECFELVKPKVSKLPKWF